MLHHHHPEAGDVSTLFPRQRGSRLCLELGVRGCSARAPCRATTCAARARPHASGPTTPAPPGCLAPIRPSVALPSGAGRAGAQLRHPRLSCLTHAVCRPHSPSPFLAVGAEGARVRARLRSPVCARAAPTCSARRPRAPPRAVSSRRACSRARPRPRRGLARPALSRSGSSRPSVGTAVERRVVVANTSRLAEVVGRPFRRAGVGVGARVAQRFVGAECGQV